MSEHYVSQKLNNQLTSRLKKEINEHDLIDTKRMYDETEVYGEIDNATGVLTLQIFSTNYLKYLFLNYQLDEFVNRDGGLTVRNIYNEWVNELGKEYPSILNLLKRIRPFIIFKINGEVAF